jgi:hypothetical protein
MGRVDECTFFAAMFFCKIVARLGLPLHTHEMTWRCDAIVGFDAMFFCKIVASRARNPRFYFVHVGTKPGFRTKNGHQKSGIPCSGCKSGFTSTHA